MPSSLSPRTAVFLDFDGVLQTPAWRPWREMEHRDELRGLLAGMPDLALVVTSTPREGKTPESLRAMLPPDIAPRVIGATPVMALGQVRGARQPEIELWLSQHPEVQAWVSGDAKADLFQRKCWWLVLAHPWIGWNARITQEVRKLLTYQAGRAGGLAGGLAGLAPPTQPKPCPQQKANSRRYTKPHLSAKPLMDKFPDSIEVAIAAGVLLLAAGITVLALTLYGLVLAGAAGAFAVTSLKEKAASQPRVP